jgi:hypothetical protein
MEGRKDVPYCMYCASMLLYFTRVSYQCHSGGCELVSDVKIFAGHDFQFFIIMVTLRLSYTCFYQDECPAYAGIQGFSDYKCKASKAVLTAEQICFKNVVMSYMFRIGEPSNASLLSLWHSCVHL